MPGVIRRFTPALRPVLALLAVAILASFAWAFFATPPRLDVVEGGLVPGPGQAERRFGVIVVYLVIGSVAGLVWGGWATRVMGRVFGPAVVPVYIVLLTAAAALVEWLGGLLGPADPLEQDLVLGQSVLDQMALDSQVFWLAWPIGGVLALLVVVYWTSAPLYADDKDGD